MENVLNFKNAIKLKMRIMFLDETLGSQPNSKEIVRDYIASNAPDALSKAEEIAMAGVDDVFEKNTTVFPRMIDGRLCSLNYQWEGYMKDICGFLRRIPGTLSSKESSYKKVIDGTMFVLERRIPFTYNGKELYETDDETMNQIISICERPLRASTPQGDRTALASSESLPPGTMCEFTILVTDAKKEALVREWFTYGALHGFSQWRNSGKGIFDYTCEVEPATPEDFIAYRQRMRDNMIESIRARGLEVPSDLISSDDASDVKSETNNDEESSVTEDIVSPPKKRGRPKKNSQNN